MFTSSSAPGKVSERVTCIISPCHMMACVLANLLAAGQTQTVFSPGIGEESARFVVYLPAWPDWLLVVLRKVADLLDCHAGPLPMLILSRGSASWIWRSLQKLVQKESYLSGVRLAPSVPVAISNSETLFGIIKQLSNWLINPFWTDRLVLKISEDLNLLQHQESGFFIIQLQHQGYRVMLDDCFSQSTVYFPVRAVRFNDYKLDRKVVADGLALIKSLAYYCELTGSYCVAEGIDSREKLRLLLEQRGETEVIC